MKSLTFMPALFSALNADAIKIEIPATRQALLLLVVLTETTYFLHLGDLTKVANVLEPLG